MANETQARFLKALRIRCWADAAVTYPEPRDKAVMFFDAVEKAERIESEVMFRTAAG